MTAALDPRLVDSLPAALTVRRLRNSCARYMTNFRGTLSWWTQTKWYWRSYRAALKAGRYRVFLFFENRKAVGYGALQLEDGKLLVTECVAEAHRGRGLGTAILAELIRIARREKRDLLAEIWITNEPSIRLHLKAGFTFVETREHQDSSLNIYLLRAS